MEGLSTPEEFSSVGTDEHKKNVNLALVSFHGMMATGITVGIVPAFEEFAIEYHTTTVKASYLATTPVR
jgi:hypothetical protein